MYLLRKGKSNINSKASRSEDSLYQSITFGIATGIEVLCTILVEYYGYYPGGDLKYKISPRGIKEEYSYNLRGLVERVTWDTYGAGDFESTFWSNYGGTTDNGGAIAADANWVQKEWSEYAYNAVGAMLTNKMFVGTATAWSQVSEVGMEYNSRNQVTTLTRKIPNNLPENPGDSVNLSTYILITTW